MNSLSLRGILVATGLVGACGVADDAPDVASTSEEINSPQGTLLQSRNPLVRTLLGADGAWYEPRTSQGVTLDVRLSGATLIITREDGTRLANREIKDLLFYGYDSANQKIELQVSFPGPFNYLDRTVQQATEYSVTYRRKDAGESFRSLCPDSFASRAIPLAGVWSSDGDHVASSYFLTFACREGALAKCAGVGYEPWVSGEAAHHQTCTRTMRADYCADGRTFTIDGTPIDLFDGQGYVRADHEDGLWVEAGWRPDEPVLCLSKYRWATLPLGGPCPDRMPDPRTTSSAVYCEDLLVPRETKQDCSWGTTGPECRTVEVPGTEYRKIFDVGAYVVSESAHIDAGLFTWKKSDAKDTMTTTTGWYGGVRADETQPPKWGYGEPKFQGAVFSAHLASTPELLPEGTVPLYRYYNSSTGDYYTTTRTSGTSGYVLQEHEGYVYAPGSQPAGTIALRTYQRLGTNDLHTTTTNLSSSASYKFIRLEGYLPR